MWRNPSRINTLLFKKEKNAFRNCPQTPCVWNCGYSFGGCPQNSSTSDWHRTVHRAFVIEEIMVDSHRLANPGQVRRMPLVPLVPSDPWWRRTAERMTDDVVYGWWLVFACHVVSLSNRWTASSQTQITDFVTRHPPSWPFAYDFPGSIVW